MKTFFQITNFKGAIVDFTAVTHLGPYKSTAFQFKTVVLKRLSYTKFRFCVFPILKHQHQGCLSLRNT